MLLLLVPVVASPFEYRKKTEFRIGGCRRFELLVQQQRTYLSEHPSQVPVSVKLDMDANAAASKKSSKDRGPELLRLTSVIVVNLNCTAKK
jgi:hypothetical protein